MHNLEPEIWTTSRREKTFSGLEGLYKGTGLSEVELWVIGTNWIGFGEPVLSAEIVGKIETWLGQLKKMLVGSGRAKIDVGESINCDGDV